MDDVFRRDSLKQDIPFKFGQERRSVPGIKGIANSCIMRAWNSHIVLLVGLLGRISIHL